MAQPSQFELSTEQYLVANHFIASSVADVQFFTAPVKCQVVTIREVHTVAGSDGSDVTATIRRCQGTEAATAGDDLLGTTTAVAGVIISVLLQRILWVCSLSFVCV